MAKPRRADHRAHDSRRADASDSVQIGPLRQRLKPQATMLSQDERVVVRGVEDFQIQIPISAWRESGIGRIVVHNIGKIESHAKASSFYLQARLQLEHLPVWLQSR